MGTRYDSAQFLGLIPGHLISATGWLVIWVITFLYPMFDSPISRYKDLENQLTNILGSNFTERNDPVGYLVWDPRSAEHSNARIPSFTLRKYVFLGDNFTFTIEASITPGGEQWTSVYPAASEGRPSASSPAAVSAARADTPSGKSDQSIGNVSLYVGLSTGPQVFAGVDLSTVRQQLHVFICSHRIAARLSWSRDKHC